MTTAPVQRSFADGELAPSMYARTDSLRYARGLRTCRNMIVLKEGGATNRPGTDFIKEVKDSSLAVRLIEFILDTTDVTDTYVLEFGNGFIRFYQDGARVTVSGLSAWANATAYTVGDLVSDTGVNYYCIADHTSATATDRPGAGTVWQTDWYALTSDIYEIPSPYATADLPDIRYTQYGDVITLVHPTYGVRELTRSSSTRWTLSLLDFGPAIDAPDNLAATGGTAGIDTWYAVTAVKAGSLEESLPSTYKLAAKVPTSAAPVTVTWDNVVGALSYNVYRSDDGGATYVMVRSAGGTLIAKSQTTFSDSSETATAVVPFVTAQAPGQVRCAVLAAASDRAQDGKYTVHYRQTLTVPATGAGGFGRIAFYYSRDSETRVLAGYSDYVTANAAGVYASSHTTTIDVPDNGYTTLTIDAVPEVQSFDVQACTMNMDTASSPDNSVTWSVGALTFTDNASGTDAGQAPPTQEDLFGAVGSYPAAVGEYQQRRLFANTPADPAKVWASRIGSRASFAMSTPLQDDDVVEFTLVGARAKVVKHLLDLSGLIIFTTSGTLVVGGNDADVLTPDSIRPKQINANGIGDLRPLPIDQSAIWVSGRRVSVRDLTPVQASGGLGGYEGNELSIFASHLFRGYQIVDWTYAEEPYGVVWCVRSDGVLLGLTYLRAFGLWAWHRHDTDGEVENVCVIPEGAEDAVYLGVKRTINGATVRYIERMHSRLESDIVNAVFMDCAITIDGRHTGTTTMTLSGGSTWDNTEQLTLTASASYFVVGDVGHWIYLTGADGSLVRCAIEAYTSATVVTVRADRAVPVAMQSAAIGNGSGSWGKAYTSLTGLSHLEGKEVAVLGDGFVLASPNNWTLDSNDAVVREYPAITVSAGAIDLPSPAMVVQVGLPYISDLETLDLDGPGPRTNRDTKKLVASVGLFLQDSRGVWAGRPDQVSDDDPLDGLDEMKPRESEGYDDPPSLVTDYRKIDIGTTWNSNGRVLIRQVDPLPMTVLSVSPIGYGT